MAVDYYTLSGTPINIEENLLSSNVKSYDMFLVSKFVLSNVSPFRTYESNGTIYRNEYWSMHTTYDSLSNQLYDDLVDKYGFKSMAWESSAHYSLIGHIHNYSKVSAYAVPELRMDKNKSNADELVNIVTFSIDSKKTDMYMPYVHLYEVPKPYIGQLKFLARDKIDAVNINAADFDGWTYPDGKALLSDAFPEAWNVFGTTYGSNSENKTFNIPNLRDFLKFAQASSTVSFAEKINYNRNPLSSHSHTIDSMSLDGSINVSGIRMDLTNTKQSADDYHTDPADSAFHCGLESAKPIEIPALVEFKASNFTIDGMVDTDNSNEALANIETHPSYNTIPVLMYIGERKTN